MHPAKMTPSRLLALVALLAAMGCVDIPEPGSVEVTETPADNNATPATSCAAANATVWFRDQDGDGYGSLLEVIAACDMPAGFVPNAGDCDDQTLETHPGVVDRCDGLDNNCDGRVDEASSDLLKTCPPLEHGVGDACDAGSCRYTCQDGFSAPDGQRTGVTDCSCAAATAQAWHRDADGDGFGAANLPALMACAQPPGYVDNDADCADDNSTIHPGAPELCDLLDNNCDGRVNEDITALLESCPALLNATPVGCSPFEGCVYQCVEGFTDAEGNTQGRFACDCQAGALAIRYYQDNDNDGYGASYDAGIPACTQPERTVTNNDDCNDNDPQTYPGAAERCDTQDNDCDGSLNEDDGALLESCPTLPHANLVRCGSNDSVMDEDGGEYSVGCIYDCEAGFSDTNRDLPRGYYYGSSSADSDGCECAAEDILTWYRDRDGDGFGEGSAYGSFGGGDQRQACTQPEGYVRVNGDCRDNNRDINPMAAEVCDDGVDNDCDGYSDNCCDCRNPIDACANTTCYREDRTCNDLAPCDMGYSCQQGRCLCSDPTVCGVRCTENADCQPEQQCDPDRSVCRPRLPCIADSMCDEDGGEVCRCTYDAEVTPGICLIYGQQPRCVAPPTAGARAVGESCQRDGDCLTLLCEGNICLQPCALNQDCSSVDLLCTTGSGSRLGCRVATSCTSCTDDAQRCIRSNCQTFGEAGICETTADCTGQSSCTISEFQSNDGAARCYPLRSPQGEPVTCAPEAIWIGNFNGYCFIKQSCWEDANCPMGYSCRSGLCANPEQSGFF